MHLSSPWKKGDQLCCRTLTPVEMQLLALSLDSPIVSELVTWPLRASVSPSVNWE